MQDRSLDSGDTEGFKRDLGKPRMDLIDPAFLEELARVLTFGSEKYDPSDKAFENNWRAGMRWGRVYAATQRHLNAFWRGEDLDPETGLAHVAHAAFGCMALFFYMQRHRRLDDRDLPWRNPRRFGCDIDGVLCNTYPSVLALNDEITGPWEEGEMPHYAFPRGVVEPWCEQDDNEEFYMGMPPLMKGEDMPFEPVVYVTARSPHGPGKYASRWLEKNGFPPAPVVCTRDKVAALREYGVDIFVEDNFDNFVEINKAGILCYLYDQPYNRKYDVGGLRITSLDEIS